jgi:drug/metabolite transporter (DMT)-like permease
MAFAAPAIWALVNIIDVYFTAEVYEDEYDGVIISGMFHIIPWVLAPIIGYSFPETGIALTAFLGGVLLVLSSWFYFRSLFAIGDASLIQTLWNSTAIIVPVLAFLLIGEKLSILQYVGIAIVFSGLMILSLGDRITKKNVIKILPNMIGAVVFFSLSMVAQEKVYSHAGFWNGFMTFSLGAFAAGLAFLVIRSFLGKTSHLLKLNKDYVGWFIGAEILAILGNICSQRAISLAPAVSLVAVIDSLMPAFILAESLLIFLLLKVFSSNGHEIMEKIHKGQVGGFGAKIVAIIVMAIGIYLINLKLENPEVIWDFMVSAAQYAIYVH